MARIFITTAIPYVNGQPHLGHALELIQADVLARYYRQQGNQVKFQTGTDDNALKNVQSAFAANMSTSDYVSMVADRFFQLKNSLNLSFDEFIKTSSDPRHRPAVEKLWHACEQNDDFYQKNYEGLYCVGCEQFYTDEELDNGFCREHGTIADKVKENNWFFRLSKYQDQLLQIIKEDIVKIKPEHRKNEVIAFISKGLQDFSISRSLARAHGWGIPVPTDTSQIIYVWWDALTNYISTIDYAVSESPSYKYWWKESDEKIHIIGKGVIRFHAVYWLAMLLAAKEPLPSTIYVHEYLTANGFKISKSVGNIESIDVLLSRYNADYLRWWMFRDVSMVGDTNFSHERVVARVNNELSNSIGNLVNRTVSMIVQYKDGIVPSEVTDDKDSLAVPLKVARDGASLVIEQALKNFDFRAATNAILEISDEANRYVVLKKPWELAKEDTVKMDFVLYELLQSCLQIGKLLEPFLPESSAKIIKQCTVNESGRLDKPFPIFPRLT